MKIAIKWDETKLTLRVPTGLVLNRFTAGFGSRMLKKEGIHLTRRQTVLFIKELKKYRRHHRDWNLVEVTENDNHVIIKI